VQSDTVLLFTRNGLGEAAPDLQAKLAGVYLSLLEQSGDLPAKILFYTEGVKLACAGSPVLDQLRLIESKGTELILCKTCLDYFGLTGQVAIGIVGGMTDILEAMQKADKVISL
jgi:sulfur relay (sulfurtransferase) complex TusBCD TusD component (DsrE family)